MKAQPETIAVGTRRAKLAWDWKDGTARYRLNREVSLQRLQRGKWYAYITSGPILGPNCDTPEEAVASLAKKLTKEHACKVARIEKHHAKLMKAVTG